MTAFTDHDLLAIDPGNEKSGYCWIRDGKPLLFGIVTNAEMLKGIDQFFRTDPDRGKRVACECIASYGMPVGREVFETCMMIGRIIERCEDGWNARVQLVYRKDVKLHLCNSPRANDATIWQAILDRYGGKEFAVGRKAQQGVLYGLTSHCRAALAVGLYSIDKPEEE